MLSCYTTLALFRLWTEHPCLKPSELRGFIMIELKWKRKPWNMEKARSKKIIPVDMQCFILIPTKIIFMSSYSYQSIKTFCKTKRLSKLSSQRYQQNTSGNYPRVATILIEPTIKPRVVLDATHVNYQMFRFLVLYELFTLTLVEDYGIEFSLKLVLI